MNTHGFLVTFSNLSVDPEEFHLVKSDIPKIKNEENNYTNKKDIKYS